MGGLNFKKCLDEFVKTSGKTCKEIALCLNVSEATIHRWKADKNGHSPSGPASAILGLLVYLQAQKEKKPVSREIETLAEKGMTLYCLLTSLIDPKNKSVKRLQELCAVNELKSMQQKEFQILDHEIKEIEEAERQAKRQIRKLHNDQRDAVKRSYEREEKKIERKLKRII